MLEQRLETVADNAKPGLSVREVMAQAFSQTDRQIWHEIIERTTGDVAPVVADLFDVVRYLFLADCQQKRPKTWKRPLSVNLPVRAIKVWQRREVQETLNSLLEFTCGDDVALHFEDVHAPAPRVQPCLSFETKYRVCLLSDGLDSLCGLTQRLSVDSATRIIAATCLTQYQVKPRARHIVSDLNATFGHRVLPVAVPLYRTGYRTRPPGEKSQRLRSVLLLGMGAVIALLAGQSGLEVYENGIEVCNFPLALTPEPERLSRAMHPVLLKRMSSFLSALADREFVCSAPFALDTKAEMAKATRLILPDQTLLRTVSCMHYRNTQCGGCEGCVLRRQALFCAGVADAASKYRFDIYSGRGASGIQGVKVAQERAERTLYSINNGLYRLRKAMAHPNSHRALMHLSGINYCDREEFLSALAEVSGAAGNRVREKLGSLYKRYAEEWDAIIPNVQVLPSPDNKAYTHDRKVVSVS